MKAIDFVKSHAAKGKTDFLEMAKEIKENWEWQRYSYAVAIKASGRMRALGLTQNQLAEKMGCTQQHVSNLLKGKVNMTLETMAKLEKALNFDLIGNSLLSFGDIYHPFPNNNNSRAFLLNDQGPDANRNLSTKGTVDGYGNNEITK